MPRPLCTEKRGRLLFLSFFLLGQSPYDFLLRGLEPLFTVLAGFLGLQPVGLSLVHQKLLVSLVCLQLADMFHKNLLGFEHITLHFKVQAVIHVVVNRLRFTVSSEKPAQNSQLPHPGYLLIGALAVPFPLPMPMCIPFQWVKVSFQHRAREWTIIVFQIISPSLISF